MRLRRWYQRDVREIGLRYTSFTQRKPAWMLGLRVAVMRLRDV